MYFLTPFPFIFIFTIIYFPVSIIFLIRKGNFKLSQFIIRTVFIYYILLVISLTWFSIPLITRWSAHIHSFTELNQQDNFIPFLSISNTLFHSVGLEVILKQLGGNILLFLPFGFLLPLVSEKYHNPIKMLIASILFSLYIELGQAVISFIVGITYRSTDIDDVILNTLGGMIGFCLIKLPFRLLSAKKK